jgi:flagellar basal-body rod protein FlgB
MVRRLQSLCCKESFMNALFGKTIDMLASALDFRAARHKVITANVANLDTPGYRPSDITFQNALQQAGVGADAPSIMRTDPRHLPAEGGAAQFEVHETGERVSLDGEMVNLAENQLMYNLNIELLARKFRGLNTVLKETR